MHNSDEIKVREEICPLIDKGEVSLLLGAGFSYKNPTANGLAIPNGDDLRDIFLNACKRTAGVRTTLKDAYLLASRILPNFDDFLADCFTVDEVPKWQSTLFHYPWNRVYTTNIDNVLEIAHAHAKYSRKLGGEFSFFNYCEPGVVNNALGAIPVVTIHGSISKPKDGFIFSTLEYGVSSAQVLDWHNELAARVLMGGLVVVGNQLDEADIDAHLARRRMIYGDQSAGKNWIVMPDPDEIKKENYISSGFDVIDSTAEEFFNLIYATIKARTIEEIILDSLPGSRTSRANIRAMTWFKVAFRPVMLQLDDARRAKGILRHFVTGVEPEWFYIVNSAHARTARVGDLIRTLGITLKSADKGVRIVHVTGPSGSGKTTTIRAALHELVDTYPYIYEYDSANGIDVTLLTDIVRGFSAKTVIVFYGAAEFYYAIVAIANRFKNSDVPLCTFILEDRVAEYQKSKHQLSGCGSISQSFEMQPLTVADASCIAEKIEEHGQSFPNFSEYPLERRAGMIVNKERGYSGDLLTALFSLTTHENFEQKIFEDYSSVRAGIARQALDAVAIMNHLGYSTPIRFVAGFLSVNVDSVLESLQTDLEGIILKNSQTDKLSCRHRIIASYYVNNIISGRGNIDAVLRILTYLSEQFSISDIRHHPLAYQMYRDLISFDFLYEQYFPVSTRDADTEHTYHEMQKLYGKDGIFWLHFGRYYRKIGKLDLAIDCFRTGLGHYDSFQTRHSLGTALLEQYINSGGTEVTIYEEGVLILDKERLSRGTSDPYPTTTLVSLLLKVLKLDPSHSNAAERLKQCINYGLKHFKGDRFFDKTIKDYFELQKNV